MSKASVKRIFREVIAEHVVKKLWTYLILLLGVGNLSIISIKKKLVQYPAYAEISFWLLLATITLSVVILIWAMRIHWRYGRFFEAFGVFWDKIDNMRCLSCRTPLKHSSTDISVFYCSDPKCNSKHVLRKSDGTKISRSDAIPHLKGLRAIKKVGEN